LKRLHPRLTYRSATILLTFALAALLVFAATATAETRTGETSSVLVEGRNSPEATLVDGAVSYETTGGKVAFDITTGAEPQAEDVYGEPSGVTMIAGLFTTSGECRSSLGTVLDYGHSNSQALAIVSNYGERVAVAQLGIPSESSAPLEGAAKTVAGTKTTLSFASDSLVEMSFNCAVIEVAEPATENKTIMGFPVKTPPPPEPEPISVPAPAAVPAPVPAPAPAPASLSIAKAKPLKLKVGKSKTVKIKVTNTGAAATGPGSLRVKAPAGVLVKPEKQKIPILAPGASWTLPVRLQLTATAKPKSTISLTGTAPGLSATGSFVVKLGE